MTSLTSNSDNGSNQADAWPTDITLDPDKTTLSVTFDTGHTVALPAELLRVMSPSAEVQGHSPEQRVTVAAKRHVRIKDIRPIGNYAIQIVFDDGHDTGYFRWGYLFDLGTRLDEHWGNYFNDLAAKGLTRS
jgi:DUF971 family protein